MAPNLNKSIQNFNQITIKRELTAVLIIQNQLQALTDDMVMHYPASDVSKELQKKIHASAAQAIKDMLQAGSKEAFIAYRERLDRLLTQLEEKLSLKRDDESLNKALQDYRFYRQLQGILHDMTVELAKSEKSIVPEWFKKHAEYGVWEQKLEHLRSLTEQADKFDDHRHELMANLILHESEQNLANLASLALIKQNIRSLADARLSYLKEINDRKRLAFDLTWIAGGILLTVAGGVLGLAFPVLIIPAIVVGAITFGHGALDFAKESTEFWSEMQDIELEERTVSAKTVKDLQELEQKIPGFEKGKFLERLALYQQEISAEKKWLRGLGTAIAFAGLALGVSGIVFLIPGIGIPLAGVIALTALAVAVTVAAMALWGFKVAREQEKLSAVQKEAENQIIADQKMISAPVIGLHAEDNCSSSAKIFLRELEEKNIPLDQLKASFFEEVESESQQNSESESFIQKQKEQRLTGGEENDEDEGDGESPSKTVH